MIVCIFGLPGAGKTTLLTRFSIRALRDKPLFVGHLSFRKYIGSFRHYKRVFSNVPLAGCFKLDFDHLGKYEYDESLILIDEAGTLCDSRQWKNFDDQLHSFSCTSFFLNLAPITPAIRSNRAPASRRASAAFRISRMCTGT